MCVNHHHHHHQQRLCSTTRYKLDVVIHLVTEPPFINSTPLQTLCPGQPTTLHSCIFLTNDENYLFLYSYSLGQHSTIEIGFTSNLVFNAKKDKQTPCSSDDLYRENKSLGSL